MKQKWLLLTVVLLLLLVPITAKPIPVSASDQSAAAIQVLVNGKRSYMEQQPVIIGRRMFVPIRAVSNLLDANVVWDQQRKSITVKKDGITSLMTLNQYQATITYENGAKESIQLDAPPTLINNSTYVPIRFVSEALGASVAWAKSTNGGSTLTITTAGSNTPSPVSSINLTLGSFTVALGDSVQSVKDALGAPDRIDKSVYNFDWYVYNSDYSKFIMIGIDDAKTVRGFYTNAKGFSYNGGEVLYGDQGTKTINGVKLYRDSHAKDAVYAILVAPSADSAKFIENAEVRRANELQNWDATNAFRVNYGLSPLGIDEEAAKAAALHSQDMADQDYFSHTGLDNRSPWDRYAASKGKLFANAENIAAGYMLGIDNFDGWVNSLGHRKNMLNETSTHLGVGSGYNAKSKYKHYYAQLFSTDKYQ